MSELFYAVEAVGGHLIGGYEYGLRLSLTPLIETLIVEAFCLVIYVCVLVWDVAVYHAVFGYADLFIVKHRGCDGQDLPPRISGQTVLPFSVLQAMQLCCVLRCAVARWVACIFFFFF